MKNFGNLFKSFFAIGLVMIALCFTGCERVQLNHYGVLMTNYGKSGKSDFRIVTGRVNVMAWGTELYQVPAFEQRGEFDSPDTLKAADNTEFSARPVYSYKVMPDKPIDVIFDNKHIGIGDDFLDAVEDNILEPRIYDLMKEESRKYETDTLMANKGSLMFEKRLEAVIKQEFAKRGFELLTFSAQLEFSKKVKDKIDSRNEVNTNVTVLDQQIIEQRKRNELEELKTQQAIIASRGLTKEILYKQFIDKWDGKTPLYGVTPEFLRITK